MKSELQAMLDAFGLADQFSVHQADACELRCRECGEVVRAECVDLHTCGEPTADYGDVDRFGRAR